MTQARLKPTFIDPDFIVKRKKTKLTPAEKFYGKIAIDYAPYVRYPGRYGIKKHDCGTLKYVYTCPCGKTNKIVKKSCNNLNCPNCYIVALRRQAKTITERLLAINRFKKRQGTLKPYFNHITFGPKDVPYMDYDAFMKWKRAILNKIKKNFRIGGVLFFHPYRVKIIEKTTSWKTNPQREKVIQTYELYYSPHFHLIGNSYIPKDAFDKLGFVVKKILIKDTHKPVKLFKEKHLRSTVGYILTHSGFYENKKISTWIGEYSYNKLRETDRKETRDYIICEFCEEYVYRLEEEPRHIDKNYLYFSIYWKSYLNTDKRLYNKIITYELEPR